MPDSQQNPPTPKPSAPKPPSEVPVKIKLIDKESGKEITDIIVKIEYSSSWNIYNTRLWKFLSSL